MVVFNLALALEAYSTKKEKSDFYRLVRRRKEDVKKSVLDFTVKKHIKKCFHTPKEQYKERE